MTLDTPGTSRTQPWVSWLLIAIVVLFALWLRWYYVVSVQVLQPAYLPGARGDAVDYYRYAWNMLYHGVFSHALPGPAAVAPDSFRDPGYPALMAVVLKAAGGDWDVFYGTLLLTQAALGACTVGFLLVVARCVLGFGWMIAAGIAMAVWPHSVAAASFLLSESLLAFLLALGLMCLALASDRAQRGWLIAAGLVFSMAALTNAVVTPFAPLAALALGWKGAIPKRFALILAFASLLGPGAWAIRNATIPPAESAGERVAINLVQGSWPNYHADYQLAMKGDPVAQSSMEAIDRDISRFGEGPSAGLSALWSRLRASPWKYLGWYLGKPALLWSWDIRMGQGDIYVYPTRKSPYITDAWLRVLWAVARAANGLLGVLAVLGSILAIVSLTRKQTSLLAPGALLLAMATAIYAVLQSEPRYAIALRGVEILVAFSAMAWLAGQVNVLRKRERSH